MTIHKRPALSRIELILLLALFVTAIGLLLSAWQKIRDDRTAPYQALDSLKQMAFVIHNCNDVYKRLPPAWGEFPPRADATEPQKTARATVHVWLLPFVEHDREYKELTEGPPKGGRNYDTTRCVWRLSSLGDVFTQYLAPLDYTTSDGTVAINGRLYGVQNFAANIRLFGPLSGNGAQPGVEPPGDSFDGVAIIPKSMPDGTSNVIVFATHQAQCGSGGSTWSQIGTATLGPFGGNGAFFGSNISPTLNANGDNTSGTNTTFHVAPTVETCTPLYPQSFGSGGLQVGMADGTVRTISPNISIRTWSRLVIPNDGFALDGDWSK